MRRTLILLVAMTLAGCGGESAEQAAVESTLAPTTTQQATTSQPPATLAPETTSTVPTRARALQARLKRKFAKVRSVTEASDTITIKTSYIFSDDNALAAVDICEAAKAALADSSFIEVMAVDDRWLARTTLFTGRCKTTTLVR
jgi:PBP1b-binding outer membrane lipoprotein LpoB